MYLLLSTWSIHWPGDMLGRKGLWPVTGCEEVEEKWRRKRRSRRSKRRSRSRAPADHEVSVKDSGFTRTGLGVTALCLHTAT